MVHAAYSSGHAALGVGSGNTPAIIAGDADIQMAVSSVLLSKQFDNGMICASEQSVVVVDSVYDQVRAEFIKRGAHFLTPAETVSAGQKIAPGGRLNVDIVGQSVQKLSTVLGLNNVPKGARIIIGEVSEVGKQEPWSTEKLSQLLAMYRVPDFHAAVATAGKLVDLFGAGHTSVLYTNPDNHDQIREWQTHVKTVRMLINTPASQGAIGDVFNFHLDPSLTLGCGSWGDTSVSANVNPTMLLNIKNVVSRRENMLWFRVPPKVYFKGGALELGLKELKGKQRAFIVTDKPLYDMKVTDPVVALLDSVGVRSNIFYDVEPDPTLATVRRGLHELLNFKPDVIIALGGGSPIDAAKIMWLLYEAPDTKFENLASRFMDIRKRVNELPTDMGKMAYFVAIPTTSGTGSEVTPFSVITDEVTHQKYPLADYALTPHMAIVDPNLVLRMPKRLTAYGGIDAVTHALESYVSCMATEFTQGLSREALRLLFENLPRSYRMGEHDPVAREKVHYAATIAGMAFANAFLGICHSMAHKLGASFGVPHGLANALLISHVIAYNATDAPFKQATFSQYQYPHAKTAYAELSRFLGFSHKEDSEDIAVLHLIEAVERLKAELDIPSTIKEAVGAQREAEYMAHLDQLADDAFDDQCTGANPRYPLIVELRSILQTAWSKPVLPLTNLDYYLSSVAEVKLEESRPHEPVAR